MCNSTEYLWILCLSKLIVDTPLFSIFSPTSLITFSEYIGITFVYYEHISSINCTTHYQILQIILYINEGLVSQLFHRNLFFYKSVDFFLQSQNQPIVH